MNKANDTKVCIYEVVHKMTFKIASKILKSPVRHFFVCIHVYDVYSERCDSFGYIKNVKYFA